jgi:hypothetical protein
VILTGTLTHFHSDSKARDPWDPNASFSALLFWKRGLFACVHEPDTQFLPLVPSLLPDSLLICLLTRLWQCQEIFGNPLRRKRIPVELELSWNASSFPGHQLFPLYPSWSFLSRCTVALCVGSGRPHTTLNSSLHEGERDAQAAVCHLILRHLRAKAEL